MIAFALCLIALFTCRLQARRSLSNGLITLLIWAYFYGIVRANVPSTASYFIFDCGVIGFYIGRAQSLFADKSRRTTTVRIWAAVLMGWPCLVCFFPFQDFFVSLVGLRGSVFFLPMLLVGAQLTNRDLGALAKGIAALNLASFGFAMAEYFIGVTRFYPPNAVTRIIYASNDVAGWTYHRIPAIFVTAHSYGNAMVLSLPLLFGFWVRGQDSAKAKLFVLLSIISAFIGILLSATRLNFALGAGVVVAVMVGNAVPMKKRLLMIAVLVGVGLIAVNNQRMARFKSLDSQTVTNRIGGSVNRSFWEIINEYPMGNGLGGGGTSIPAFLIDRVRGCVTMENEYGRIALELGLPGLTLWVAFLFWFAISSFAFVRTPWQTGRRAAWTCCILHFLVAAIGVGLFTTIPGTLMVFLMMGWVAVKPPVEETPQDEQLNQIVVPAWEPEPITV